MGVLIYIVALVLALFLIPIGVIYAVFKSFWRRRFKDGFKKIDRLFFKMAISIDQLGNVACYELFNEVLIKANGYQFGDEDETISSVLGKNKIAETLTKTGKALDWVLEKLDRNHSIESIE